MTIPFAPRRWEATIDAGRPNSAPAVVKPQHHGSCGQFNFAGRCRSDIHPMRCRGAKSFVDDLVLSRGVVLSRAATLLRSIETKPFDSKICPLWTDASSWLLVSLRIVGGTLLGAIFLFVLLRSGGRVRVHSSTKRFQILFRAPSPPAAPFCGCVLFICPRRAPTAEAQFLVSFYKTKSTIT